MGRRRSHEGWNVDISPEELDDRDKLILKTIAEADRPLSLSEISRATGLERSVVWRKLKKLVSRGIVDRVVVDGNPAYIIRTYARKGLERY